MQYSPWTLIRSLGRSWSYFSCLLLLVVFLRGFCLLCVLPPLEGWDEYQHLAYIEHLNEHACAPTMGVSTLSDDFLIACCSLPAPNSMLALFPPELGFRGYRLFYEKGAGNYQAGCHKAALYQAQHGVLYYRAVLPLYRALGGYDNLIATIYGLRLLNLLIGIAGLAVFLGFLGRTSSSRSVASLIAIVVCLQPLYLINLCRVANDALAQTFATVVIVGILWSEKARSLLSSALAFGILAGLAIWCKATTLAIVPFAIGCYGYDSLQGGCSRKRCLALAACFLVGCSLGAAPQILRQYSAYGAITTMGESRLLQEKGLGAIDVLTQAPSREVVGELCAIWLRRSTWRGGWSSLEAPGHRRLATLAYGIGLSCWIIFLWRKRRRDSDGDDARLALRCSLLVLSMSGAMAWHMMLGMVTRGKDATWTNPWYACYVFPFALCIVILGARQISHRASLCCGAMIAASYLSCEWLGLYREMLPTYSGGTQGFDALARIAQVHPAYMQTSALVIAFSALLVTFAFVVMALFTVFQQPDLSERKRSWQ